MGFVAQFRRSVDQESTREDGSGQLDLHLPEYATGTVHHQAILDDGTVVHHHQRFESGVLVDWIEDDEPGPWALVRPGSPLRPCPGGVADPDDVTGVLSRVLQAFTRSSRNTCADLDWQPTVTMDDALARIFEAYRGQVAEARGLIGAGEGGYATLAPAILSDLFAPRRRARSSSASVAMALRSRLQLLGHRPETDAQLILQPVDFFLLRSQDNCLAMEAGSGLAKQLRIIGHLLPHEGPRPIHPADYQLQVKARQAP